MIIMLPHGTDTKTLSFFISCCFATKWHIHIWYFQSISSLSSNDFTSCSPSMSQEMANFPRQFSGYMTIFSSHSQVANFVLLYLSWGCSHATRIIATATKQGWHLFCLAFSDMRDYSREATNQEWRLIVEIWYPRMQGNNNLIAIISITNTASPRVRSRITR